MLAASIPVYLESIKSIEKQLEIKESQLLELLITAPMAGYVQPFGSRDSMLESEELLPFWDGWPLSPDNVGAVLELGSPLCRIRATEEEWEAHLYVDESSLDRVKNGQVVILQLDAFPNDRLESRVTDISNRVIDEIPHTLTIASGGCIATETTDSGMQRPIRSLFKLRAPIATKSPLISGLRGKARIRVGSRSIWERFIRWTNETLNFKL